MKHMWDKTTQVSEELARTLLSTQFPTVFKTLQSIQWLGQGFDNTAYLINEQMVFRFPHRQEALPAMENEILILPYLAQHLSFKTSAPTLVGHSTADYPYPFSGYPVLPGELLSHYQAPWIDDPHFAKTLGHWLRELHCLPVLDDHRLQLKGQQDWRLDIANRTHRVAELTHQYADYFQAEGFDPQKLNALMQGFKHLSTQGGKSCYLHGDLYAKHIVVDSAGNPSGLIDWGDVHIGNPAIDLSVGIMIFTESALTHFLHAYQDVDAHMMKIAAFRAYCHAIGALGYFAQIQEKTTLEWTKAALTNTIEFLERL